MAPIILRANFATDDEFLKAFEQEISRSGLLIKGAKVESVTANSECLVHLQSSTRAALEIPARVAAVIPGVGVAVLFAGIPPELAALAKQLKDPSEAAAGDGPPVEDAPKGPLTERLKVMTVQEKMALALSGSRDERTMLLRDPNKVLHLYVLKNPRLGLDEVQSAARQANLSPDALKYISEHRDWSQSPTVCTALVRNPKTPLPLALRMLDRIPPNELRAIAKGGARDQLVTAARKKVSGS